MGARSAGGVGDVAQRDGDDDAVQPLAGRVLLQQVEEKWRPARSTAASESCVV